MNLLIALIAVFISPGVMTVLVISRWFQLRREERRSRR